MSERFIRTQMLLGGDAMERLAKSHVAVFGLGGVGSYSAEALARSGVGELTLVDMDEVGVSNINRQLFALGSTVGRKKAELAAERAADINPDCTVHVRAEYYSAQTRESFWNARYDYVIDAIDLVSCKLDLICQAKERGIPTVSALGTGNKLDPTQFRFDDISDTQFCPLARVVRKELRARGISSHRVLWSPEPAIEPLKLEEPPPGRRSVPASCAWVPSCAGLMLAGFVVCELAGLRQD